MYSLCHICKEKCCTKNHEKKLCPMCNRTFKKWYGIGDQGIEPGCEKCVDSQYE